MLPVDGIIKKGIGGTLVPSTIGTVGKEFPKVGGSGARGDFWREMRDFLDLQDGEAIIGGGEGGGVIYSGVRSRFYNKREFRMKMAGK